MAYFLPLTVDVIDEKIMSCLILLYEKKYGADKTGQNRQKSSPPVAI